MSTKAEDKYDNLIDVMHRRRSVRQFEKGRSVARDTLRKIVEAGRWAPRNCGSGDDDDPVWDGFIQSHGCHQGQVGMQLGLENPHPGSNRGPLAD